MQSARPIEKIAVMSFTAIAVVVVVADLGTWLRSILGFPLLLALPGFALFQLIKGSARFDLESVVLAVGLSMAGAIFCGLLLNGLNALNVKGWALCLGAVTIAASAASRLTEVRSSPSARKAQLLPWRPSLIGASVIAAVIATGAVGLARSGAGAQHEYAFTQFWMVPAPEADGRSVTVGIRNDETARTSYEIALFADGDNIARYTGITLPIGDSWSENLQIDTRLQRAKRIEAWLFKADAPDKIYRKVWISNPDNETSSSKDKG